MVKSWDSLLDLVNPQFQGILWVATRNFWEESKVFFPLDYLMNGLLVKNYRHLLSNAPEGQLKMDRRINLFSSPYFDHTLYLSHIIFKEKTIREDLMAVGKIMATKFSEKTEALPDKILVLNEVGETLLAPYLGDLKMQFKDFKFPVLAV